MLKKYIWIAVWFFLTLDICSWPNTDHWSFMCWFHSLSHTFYCPLVVCLRIFMLSCLLVFETHMHASVSYQQETSIINKIWKNLWRKSNKTLVIHMVGDALYCLIVNELVNLPIYCKGEKAWTQSDKFWQKLHQN